jgi:hypothetical protein
MELFCELLSGRRQDGAPPRAQRWRRRSSLWAASKVALERRPAGAILCRACALGRRRSAGAAAVDDDKRQNEQWDI